MSKSRTPSRLESIALINAATLDLQNNGYQSRTLKQVAAIYGCNEGSLYARLKSLGMTGSGRPKDVIRSLDDPTKEYQSQFAENSSHNSLTTNSPKSTSLLGNSKEGEDRGHLPNRGTLGALDENLVNAALERMNQEVRDVVELSMRDGMKVLPCKSASDLVKLYSVYRKTFEPLGGFSGPAESRSLVQVNILSDASDPRKKVSIINSASDSVVDLDTSEDS